MALSIGCHRVLVFIISKSTKNHHFLPKKHHFPIFFPWNRTSMVFFPPFSEPFLTIPFPSQDTLEECQQRCCQDEVPWKISKSMTWHWENSTSRNIGEKSGWFSCRCCWSWGIYIYILKKELFSNLVAHKHSNHASLIVTISRVHHDAGLLRRVLRLCNQGPHWVPLGPTGSTWEGTKQGKWWGFLLVVPLISHFQLITSGWWWLEHGWMFFFYFSISYIYIYAFYAVNNNTNDTLGGRRGDIYIYIWDVIPTPVTFTFFRGVGRKTTNQTCSPKVQTLQTSPCGSAGSAFPSLPPIPPRQYCTKHKEFQDHQLEWLGQVDSHWWQILGSRWVFWGYGCGSKWKTDVGPQMEMSSLVLTIHNYWGT